MVFRFVLAHAVHLSAAAGPDNPMLSQYSEFSSPKTSAIPLFFLGKLPADLLLNTDLPLAITRGTQQRHPPVPFADPKAETATPGVPLPVDTIS